MDCTKARDTRAGGAGVGGIGTESAGEEFLMSDIAK